MLFILRCSFLLSLLPYILSAQSISIDKAPLLNENLVLTDSILVHLIDSKIIEYPDNAEFAIAVIKKGIPYYYGIKNNNGDAVHLINYQSAFEVGSITKVFTNHLLASQILHDNLDPNLTIDRFFDLQLHNSVSISLKQLSSHSSGLPVMPPSFFQSNYDDANPYKHFNKEKLYKYLTDEITVDTSKVGKFSYSNIGVSLLGHILGKQKKQSYETLLQDEILTPLAMNNSSLSRAGIRDHLVKGIMLDGSAGLNWDLDMIQPAGGLYSTAEDLAKYLLNCMKLENELFAYQTQQIIERNKVMGQAMGWMIINSKSGKKFFFHAGATGAYSSMLVIDPQEQNAVVLLSNIETGENSIDPFCFKLMKELNRLKNN